MFDEVENAVYLVYVFQSIDKNDVKPDVVEMSENLLSRSVE